METNEVYVVYCLVTDKIMTVHADKFMADAKIQKMEKAKSHRYVACDLDTAIQFQLLRSKLEN